MRDAFGGLFMIRVLLVFLLVFITFVAVAFNYARAFRVKNKILDVIEQQEGYDRTNKNNDAKKEIEAYLNEVSYKVNYKIAEDNCGKDATDSDKAADSYGYCVKEITNDLGTYYQVKTFVVLSFPFLEDFNITIPIQGETRTIINFQ